MQFAKYNQRIKYLQELIKKGSTGSPENLAKRLGISRRMFFEYLGALKEMDSVCIKYCKRRKSYYYDQQ